MKSKYMLSLYKQYCESLGKAYFELNIFTDIDFINWVGTLGDRTKIYTSYLDNLNVGLGNESAIEIGKGKYDTLGKDLVTIVSPYAETLNLQNSEMIINQSVPIIFTGGKVFTVNGYELFLTQNPYDISSLKNFELLHNGGLNICLGVYGCIHDMDRNDKLSMLKSLYDRLNDDIQFYYDTMDELYFGCLKSERFVKRKRLTR